VFVAAITQQVSGFGYALLAVPLMSILVGPKDAVAIATVSGATASGMMALRLRVLADRPTLGRLLTGALLGMPIGVIGLRELPEDPLRIALAVVVLGMVVVLASGYRFGSTRHGTQVLAGFASGVLNTSIGTAGPPVVATLQAGEMPQHTFRATTVAFFACCNIVAVPLIIASGVVTASTWRTALVAVPSVLVGNAIGSRLAPRVGPERFRALVLGLLAVAGVGALTAALV
jgi:uncharacterized membrane protein YfcA